MTIIWNSSSPLILASNSYIRKQLLTQFSIPLETSTHSVNERSLILNDEICNSPKKIAVFLAGEKARSVQNNYRSRWIISSDQILEFDQTILHKCLNEDELFYRLKLFSGRDHKLHSAVVIIRPDGKQLSFVRTSHLFLTQLSSFQIRNYLHVNFDTGILSSVGGYHMENNGILLFNNISGSYSSILGIPIREIIEYFYTEGIVKLK